MINRGTGSAGAAVLAAALYCGAGCASIAQPAAAPPAPPVEDKELVVGTKEAPPFVMKRPDGTLSGISIELWQRIADRAHLRYRFVEQGTVPELLAGVANHTFDVAIAAVTVTAERERNVDFTQPYYTTGLGIAVPSNENGWVSVGRTVFSFGFIQAVLALIGITSVMGFLIWVVEHRKTAQFGNGVKGLGASFWWSAIAMTRGGAAQNAPATLPGRILAMCWMIASVILIAVFTAGLTSTLTKRELQGAVHGVNDLRFVPVGTVLGSSGMSYLDHQRISHRGFAEPEAGLAALQAGRIDAFVYDKPLLVWRIGRDFASTLQVLDVTFDSQSYAIVLPKRSPLRRMLDAQVLEQIESDWWEQTLFGYFGRKQN